MKRFNITLVFISAALFGSIMAQAVDKASDQGLPETIEIIKSSLAHISVPCVGTLNDEKHGTGFIFWKRDDGLVILATAKHLFVDLSVKDSVVWVVDTSEITTLFHKSPYKKYKSSLLYIDPDLDIAFLSLAYSSIAALQIRRVGYQASQLLREGQLLGCTGYDLTQRSLSSRGVYYWPSSHTGILSCKREVDSSNKAVLMQADMLLNKGASGAPVYLTNNGKVCGMVVAFEPTRDGLNSGLVNIIPLDYVTESLLQWTNSIKETEGATLDSTEQQGKARGN